MEPGSGTAVVVIAVVVVVVGVGLFLLLRHSCRLTVAGTPVAVALYASGTITVTLERKGWALASWTAVVPATYAATGGTSASAAVGGSPTVAGAPSATVTISGAATGTDTVRVTASGGDCSVFGDVPVTVT